MIRGKDIAHRDGFKTYKEWVKGLGARLGRDLETPWTGKVNEAKKNTVKARIDFGRWLADCPDCGGAELVDPDEPFFYCFSCGNRGLKGDARLVIFPGNIEEIEAVLEQRPVNDKRGRNKIEAARMARPLYPGLSRSWNPDETIEDLQQQNQERINPNGL